MDDVEGFAAQTCKCQVIDHDVGYDSRVGDFYMVRQDSSGQL